MSKLQGNANPAVPPNISLMYRCGNFGWGDRSSFAAHVFDRDGKPDPAFALPAVERDGQAFAEVRLPEGYMAILVRK